MEMGTGRSFNTAPSTLAIKQGSPNRNYKLPIEQHILDTNAGIQ